MRALRLPTPTRVAPFGDPPGELPVVSWVDGAAQGSTLAQAQEVALRAAGLTLADTPDPAEPCLVFSDRVWFTPGFLRALLAAGPGRAHLDEPPFLRDTGNLQPDPARPEVALVPAGTPPTLDLPDVAVPLGLHLSEGEPQHPAFRHAVRGGLATGTAMVHGLHHWTHVLRVNLLALAARAEEAKADWEHGSWWRRMRMAAPVVWRARGLSPARIAAALGPRGRNVRIHPTAVIEACDIGDDVQIGPFCCLRGAVIGRGARIDAYAQVAVSVIGEGARVATGAMINLCVLFPGAFVSEGGGYQMCVFGRDSFVAKTATMLDLSFGRTIRVDGEGGRVDTEGFFLGGAIGHRARVGAGVRIGYGVMVPNDVLLVAPAHDLLRRVPPDAGGVLTVADGAAVPVKP